MPAEAVLAALRALLNAIAPLRIPAALLGGLALAIWRHPRFTRDVDVLLAIDPTRMQELMTALEAGGFRPKQGTGLIRLGELEILQMIYQSKGALLQVQVDLLLAGNEFQHTALARRVPAAIPDFDSPIDVLSCEDLILLKLFAGRVIDRADAAGLLRANRETLNIDYLLQQIAAQELTGDFATVWEEAFPGESLPELGR